MSREDWNNYFMKIATHVSTRSTCDSANIGAIIVKDKNLLSTGYDGSIRGLDHCEDIGHDMDKDHCVRTIHAEANAIVRAAKNGVQIENSSMYVTNSPCWYCFKLIANSGITKIYYKESYADRRVISESEKTGIKLIKL